MARERIYAVIRPELAKYITIAKTIRFRSTRNQRTQGWSAAAIQ
jgi:hypothetical protein